MDRRLAWARNPSAWTALLTVAGLALRAYHYLRDPVVWHDEAALVLNVIGKDFGGLLGSLDYHEAAPPLFLWAERAIVLLLGDGTFALRLLPFLASCLALLLLIPVARHLLRPAAVPWAVLLLAVSERLLWHCCEAKPYSIDVLAATALLAGWCAMRSWPFLRRVAVLVPLAPVLIFLCYPGCFLCGGLLVALLPALARERRVTAWAGYGLLVAAVFGAFTLLLLGPVAAQRCELMDNCWARQFPDWEQPGTLPVWVVFSTLEVARYCCAPWGQFLVPFAAVGAVVLWRGGRRAVVVLLVLPVTLALVAAFLGAYPYGGVRVMAYAAPALVLLIAAGAGQVFAWLGAIDWPTLACTAGWPRSVLRIVTPGPLAAAVLLVPLLAPVGLTAFRTAVPWPRPDCASAAAYVLERRRPSDVCAGNLWQCSYYLRAAGPAYRPVEDLDEPPDRLWLTVSAETLDYRLLLVQYLPPGDWQVVERRDFALTSAFLLTRESRNVKAPGN